MDDRTVGLVLRALRRRRRLRQQDLAVRVGCSQSTVSRAEAGHVAALTVEQVRALFGAVEARVEIFPRWRGASLERLTDEAHAAIEAEAARKLEALGWSEAIEITYSEYGERGSIDILAVMPESAAVLVVEVKSELASAEGLLRKLDEKARLAPTIVNRRDGWVPAHVGRLVVLPESSRLRDRVQRAPILRKMLPADARAIRRWLTKPVGSIAGIWFLSNIPGLHAPRVRRAPGRAAGPR